MEKHCSLLPLWLSILLVLMLMTGCLASSRPLPVINDWKDVSLPPVPESVAERIEEHRKGDLTLILMDRDGNPIAPDTEVHIELINHEFLFGSNFFNWGRFDDQPEKQEAYRERFADLFNFATLPFYWGWYEAVENKPDRGTRSRETAEWCREHDIMVKGHPLVWHEVYPEWAMDLSEEELRARLEARVRGIVTEYAGLIDMWDVINESQVSHRYNNPFGRWVKSAGADYVVSETFSWAAESNPDGFFIINDYDIHDESYLIQVKNLMKEGTIPDAIGMQSHMHHGAWSDQKILDAYYRMEQLGLPIHFTELTVLSGRPMTGNDYGTTRTNWNTLPKREIYQAEELVRIYRLLFSLPKVEAITNWDFSDSNAWMGAPAGLLRKDMAPKPAYFYLMKLIHDEWHTSVSAPVGEEGKVSLRGFYGKYRIHYEGGSAEFRFPSGGNKTMTIRVE